MKESKINKIAIDTKINLRKIKEDIRNKANGRIAKANKNRKGT